MREDAEGDLRKPLTNMTMRGDWQLREISICLRHRHLLVPLWTEGTPTKRFNVAARLTEILPQLLTGQLEGPRIEPSLYDVWLDRRLETGEDDTWLAKPSLYAASTFCKLLGVEMLRLQTLPDMDNASQIRLGQAAGFDVARRGKSAIIGALNELSTLATGKTDQPPKAFGNLCRGLETACNAEVEFAPFRQILRDCIVTIWPIGAGKDVLGIEHPRRLLHSVNTAAQESGIGTFILEQCLEKAGAFSAEDIRSNSRKTFNAETYAELLAEIPTLVGRIELQDAMGATLPQLRSLEADGVLVPRIDIPTIKSPWRMSDGLALVSELRDLAVQIEPADPKWEAIQNAKVRSSLSVGRIIKAVRDGQLQIGHQRGINGYRSFSVLRSEIDELSAQEIAPISSKPPALILAGAFGRSVGMRDRGRFLSLIDAGHTPATIMKHPKLGSELAYVSPQDINDFHCRFLTPTTMAKEFGIHRQTLLKRLSAKGVLPFAPNGADFGALYLRSEIEAALHLPK